MSWSFMYRVHSSAYQPSFTVESVVLRAWPALVLQEVVLSLCVILMWVVSKAVAAGLALTPVVAKVPLKALQGLLPPSLGMVALLPKLFPTKATKYLEQPTGGWMLA